MEILEKEQLAEEMLALNDDIKQGYEAWKRTKENENVVKNKFSELLKIADKLNDADPGFYENFKKTKFDGQGLLDALELLNSDLRNGVGKLIDLVSPSHGETVSGFSNFFSTKECSDWVNSNPTQKIVGVETTLSDKDKTVGLIREFLPSVKMEEVGDLYALAQAGTLSENYNEIVALTTKNEKISYVKRLMAQERLFLKVDFSSLTVTDETENRKSDFNFEMFQARGVMAQAMIDSAALSSDGKELVCVCSTANKDTSSQKDQFYRIFHTLNEMKKKGNLVVKGVENPDVKFVLLNNSLFCTENKEDVSSKISAGRKGGTKVVDGYHFASTRAEFDRLIEPGQEVSKHEMDKLNGLVTLAMIGNGLSYPRYPYTFEISDIINATPETVGSDTTWMKEEFEKLRAYEGKEREQKFFEFMVNFVDDSLDVLNKLKGDVDLSSNSVQNPLIKQLAENLSRTLMGMSEGFSTYNLGEDYVQESPVFDKLGDLFDKLDSFNEKHPNSKIVTSPMDYLSNRRSLIRKGEKTYSAIDAQNKKFITTWQEQDKTEPEMNIKEAKSLDEVISGFAMQVISSGGSENSNIYKLHKRVDDLTKSLYAKGNKLDSEKRFPVYGYFISSVSRLLVENDTGFRYSKTKELSDSNSSQKKVLLERMNEAEKVLPGSSANLKEADLIVQRFMNKLSYPMGVSSIVESGGYEAALQVLVSELERELKPMDKIKNKFN